MTDDDRVRLLWEQGLTGVEMAERLGFGIGKVYRVLDRQGLRPHGASGQRPRSYKYDEQTCEAVASAYAAGEAVAVIAKRFQMSNATVNNIAHRQGVEVRRGGQQPRRFSEADRARIKALRSSGWSQQKIADEFSCHQTHISRILVAEGMQGRKPPVGRTRNDLGYVLVLVPADDPQSDMRNSTGYVLEHRLVVARALGRSLRRHETVHHINGDRADNRPENLQLRSGRHGNGVVHMCADCGSNNIVTAPIAGA